MIYNAHNYTHMNILDAKYSHIKHVKEHKLNRWNEFSLYN